MASLKRNGNGVIQGTLDYGRGLVFRTVDTIIPFLFPCTNCKELEFHVLGSQHSGLGFRVPFVGTVASTHKLYTPICNKCTCTSSISNSKLMSQLDSRILPPIICEPLDRLLAVKNAPQAYSKNFAAYLCREDPSYAPDLAWLTAYTRYDQQ